MKVASVTARTAAHPINLNQPLIIWCALAGVSIGIALALAFGG